MRRPYRCCNSKCSTDPHGRLIFDFWCEPPGKCPKCGLVENDPRSRGLIVPLMVLHFNPPHPSVGDLGTGFLACAPEVRVGTGGTRATGDPTVVTCPECAASEVHAKALATWGWTLVRSADYEVQIDPGAGTLVRKPQPKAGPPPCSGCGDKAKAKQPGDPKEE